MALDRHGHITEDDDDDNKEENDFDEVKRNLKWEI